MKRKRGPSRQTISLLLQMEEIAPEWVHGYDLMKRTGLQSGTLYPALMRMEERGLVAAEWRPAQRPGRPARHVYRLTVAGHDLARECRRAAQDPHSRGAVA